MNTPCCRSRASTLITLSLLLSGCHDTVIDVTSQINRDGSILRTETISGDSSGIAAARFPTAKDSSWTISLVHGEGATFKRVAVRLFRDAEEMNEQLSVREPSTLPIRVSLERRFLGFFTEFTYRETHLKWTPFDALPLARYVSSAEITRLSQLSERGGHYAGRDDSLKAMEADSAWDYWWHRNIFEDYFAEFLKGVDSLDDPALTREYVGARKEELYRMTGKQWTSAGSMDTLRGLFQALLGTPKVRDAVRLNSAGFASHKSKLAFMEESFMETSQTNIVMPGLIIETNAPKLEGNTASWKDVPLLSYSMDYELSVKSRFVNWWAVSFAGLIAIGSGALFVAAVVRRRKAEASL
jgi:hypothetical protein